jgi:ATP-dependent helicase YprA (DUF1998 family)
VPVKAASRAAALHPASTNPSLSSGANWIELAIARRRQHLGPNAPNSTETALYERAHWPYAQLCAAAVARGLSSGQIDLIEAVLAGRPTIAVLPTGAGKSLS